MTLEIDPITQRRLVLVKQLHGHALLLASGKSIVNRIMAVIGFDLTIETILKAVVSAMDAREQPDKTFDALIQQANDKFSKAGYNSLPDEANIRRIHDIRNDAQHKAKYPNEADISDCRLWSRDFIQKILLQLWGISLEKISLADLIQNVKAKTFLLEAESAFAQSKYEESVQKANAGLTLAINKVRDAILGPYPITYGQAILVSRYYLTPGAQSLLNAILGSNIEADDHLLKSFSRTQDILLYLALGINYADFLKFKNIAGNVYFEANGTIRSEGIKKDLSANDAEYVFSYCVDTVSEIESRVGDLDAPFKLA